MYLGIIKLTLLDYLFFSSFEYSEYYKTSVYLHNYALSYALGLCNRRYVLECNKTFYSEDLKLLNKEKIYIYPAKWNCNFYDVQFNSMKDTYYLTREKNTPFPIYGFIKLIAPESTATTYIISEKKLNIPPVIRLGKWDAATNVQIKWFDCNIIKANEIWFKNPLNYKDLLTKPKEFNITELSIPTRLVENCYFENAEVLYCKEINLSLPLCNYFAD